MTFSNVCVRRCVTSVFLQALPCVLVLALLPATGWAGDSSARRKELEFNSVITRPVALRYLMYLPRNYDSSNGDRWPLLLYLHGRRGRGTDLKRLFWYPVMRMLERGEVDVPFIVVAPQCPDGRMWTDAEGLLALVDQIATLHRVDRSRIYLAGYSMGGNGAWYLAYRFPKRFAAIAPMSATTNPWWARRLKDMPTWVFHGAKDEVVPSRESEEMVAALLSKGAPVKFTLDLNRGHSPPTEREHMALFHWFLMHRKE